VANNYNSVGLSQAIEPAWQPIPVKYHLEAVNSSKLAWKPLNFVRGFPHHVGSVRQNMKCFMRGQEHGESKDEALWDADYASDYGGIGGRS